MSAGVPENLLTVWATLLFDSLAAAGVRDVVLSPGSRSTPFVFAAGANPALRIHEVIDERTAAYFALGQARVTGRPSVLLCTSGSAAANYLPAVVEADQSGVPLIVVSADRPAELLHVSANQTIDQRLLFEGYARRVVDLGVPDAAPEALRGLRRLAAHAVALSRAPAPGAVHLNLRARKPLEPVVAQSAPARALEALARALSDAPLVRVSQGTPVACAADIARLVARIRQAGRGVIVAGPAMPAQRDARQAVACFARASGFSLMAEAASQFRFAGRTGADDGIEVIDICDWLYRQPADDVRWLPDFIVQLGAPPTSGAWERLLDRHPEVARVVISPWGWPDPYASATEMVHADIADTCLRLADALAATNVPAPQVRFARALADERARVRGVIDAMLPSGGAALSEAAAARELISRLPQRSWFAVGNSLPIRTVDTFCAAGLADVAVISQRGASGIEGLVSGAAGAAAVADDPVALLVGDISALHDIGGFALGAAARVPFVVVVVDNGGGRIFEQLPVARQASDADMRRFTTPHQVDFADLARLYRWPFAHTHTCAQLASALDEALARDGPTLICAVVPPHGAAEELMRVAQALA